MSIRIFRELFAGVFFLLLFYSGGIKWLGIIVGRCVAVSPFLSFAVSDERKRPFKCEVASANNRL